MIKFKDNWKEVFGANGFCDENNLYDFKGGEIINVNARRNVTKFAMDVNGSKQVFFMKRFFNEHYKDIIAGFKNHFAIVSQGEVEWRNANKLLEIGVETYCPVCFGVKEFNLNNMCSFVVTKEIDGECFSDVVADRWVSFSDKQKQSVLDSVASVAVKIHNEKISLPDLYVWHYYCDSDPQASKDMAVIDLHRMKLRAGERDFVKNLGGLHYSMHEKYFTNDHRNYVIEEYCRQRGVNCKRFMNKVHKRSKLVSSRRHPPGY
ncbi:MAG: lipopolysaccharide kinase InaA family protein [Sedimentisphaeraceae bacterium JB056]